MVIFNQPYPVDAYPIFIRDAAREVQLAIQATTAQVCMSINCAMAVSCQGLVVFKHPVTGQLCHTSINQMIITESGDRTTTTDSMIFAPIIARDLKATLAFESTLKEYQASHTIWSAVQKGLRSRLVKLTKGGEDVGDVQSEIEDHAQREPMRPRMRRYIRQDITARSAMDALEGDGESLAFVTDEGQVLLGGDLMRHIGLLNKIWDGAPMLTVDRADGKSIIARNVRASTSFKVHEEVLRKYIGKHGAVAKGSGYWARYLVAQPESLKGTRWIMNDAFDHKALPTFHARIDDLLAEYEKRITFGSPQRDVIEFSDDAKNEWRNIARQVEVDIQPGRWLSDISDFASKYMEIMSRLAANFHYFTQQEGKISVDTLKRAETIALWHLKEYKRLFSPQGELAAAQVDARKLAKYLRQFWSGFGSNSRVGKSEALKDGPVRPVSRLNAALDALGSIGAVGKWEDPAAKRKCFILLNDQFFAQLPV